MRKIVDIFIISLGLGLLFIIDATPVTDQESSDSNSDSDSDELAMTREQRLNKVFNILRTARRDNDLDDELETYINRRASFSTSQRQFQNEALQAHNRYRARHCVKSLTLDDSLSDAAQKYAEYLAYYNTLQHSGTTGVGENLYTSWASNGPKINGTTAVTSWYNEVTLYSYNSPGFSMSTGHFTQVVWKGTEKLGVGYAYTSDRRSVYVVAQYKPPGNYQGKFQANVLRPNSC